MSARVRLNRSSPPEPAEVRPFEFPEVHSERLGRGLDVRVVRLDALPVVTLRVVVDAGEAAVPGERAGLAVLTGNSLEGGTELRPGPALAEALERLGASLEVSVGWDAAVLGLSCLAPRLEGALALLAEVVARPAFPADEVVRYRDQQLAAIEQRRKDPRALASDMAAAFFYAPGVPYGRPLLGSRASVEHLGSEEALAFYGARYPAAGAGLIVVGDVEPERAFALAATHLGEWVGAPAPEPAFEAATNLTARRIFVVHRPDAVQSEIRIGHVGVPRDSPDFFPLVVLNTLLGGAFTSRLNLNLRERHGFTYGARSRFVFRRRAGPFMVDTAVATEVTADAVREAVGELEALLRDGPRADEVAAAKDYIAGTFPLQLETTAQVAARIADLIVHRLPDDYYRVYRDRVAAVTPDQVHAAAHRHIHPERMAIVIVGDADVVLGPLEALGIGPVEVHTPA